MNRQYWSGTVINKLQDNEVFVFGSNPEGIHGAGGAKAAVAFGARFGQGRGLVGNTYALVTKNLNAGFTEKSTGIVYEKDGYCSVSESQIRANIDELYDCSRANPDKNFLITFQYETWPNGTPKKSLNGYTSEEMFQMFVRENIPENIVFHDSYKDRLEKSLSVDNHSGKTQDEGYTFFFNLKSPFSNFHPSVFEYKDIKFVSNEQFMMYSKARNFSDYDSGKKILSINESSVAKKLLSGEISRLDIVNDRELSSQWNALMMEVKKYGRGVKNYDDDIWSAKREKIVLFGVRLKFTQNSDLMQELQNTGNSKMVEASPYDKVWGIGLSEQDAKKIPVENWPGMNLLGKVFDQFKTELANRLEQSQPSQKKTFETIEVLNFYQIGKVIPEDGVYIGRYNKNFNLQGSKFANPFPMKDQSEDERVRVVQEYKNWLWKEIANNNITREDLLSLNGKKLVCYCAPKNCHGHVLKAAVELLLNNEAEFNQKLNQYVSTSKMKF